MKYVFTFIAGLMWGVLFTLSFNLNECSEQHLPAQVTDMFTVVGDTVYLKQGVDFVISTRGIVLDTAGIIHRQK